MTPITLHQNAQIVFNNRTYSYMYIRERMDVYQSALAGAGVQSAAIAVNRSAELLILLMAMLEAEITFMTMEPDTIRERLEYFFQNSPMDAVICNADHRGVFPHSNVLTLEEMESEAQPQCATAHAYNSVAYILYTSGSTGRPKGVAIPRSALENFVEGIAKQISLVPGQHIACVTTVSFDIFLLESITALSKGLTVVLASEEEQRNPQRLSMLFEQQEVEIVQMTPSRIQMLINQNGTLGCLKNVRMILIGGEDFPPDILKKLQQCTQAKIYNLYGPTETTIWSSVADLTECDYVHIGAPLQNTEIFILDERHRPVPQGEIGEIAIAGAGLALGYINQMVLTKEKFIPFNGEGGRIYLTGDFGRRLPDETLQYTGRIDNQVKINGHRIELEEIEAVLNTHHLVSKSIAIVDDRRGYRQIIAFYTGNHEVNRQRLLDSLATKLPAYMMPARFIYVLDFPLTVNGKIDRKMLNIYLSDEYIIEKTSANYERLDTAEKVLAILTNLVGLKIQQVTTETSLAELGVDSISFIKLIVLLEDAFKIQFDDEMLLFAKFPFLRQLIDYIDEKKVMHSPR